MRRLTVLHVLHSNNENNPFSIRESPPLIKNTFATLNVALQHRIKNYGPKADGSLLKFLIKYANLVSTALFYR